MRRTILIMSTMTLALILASGVAMAVTTSFSTPRHINIPELGPANPYPSTLQVSGLSGTVTDVNLTLKRFSHTWPGDLVVTLEDPSHNVSTVMSGNGNGTDIQNSTLVLDDEATNTLPDSSNPLSAGTYKPSNNLLAAFDGYDPNGTWKLYVDDISSYDRGKIGGWSLQITTN